MSKTKRLRTFLAKRDGLICYWCKCHLQIKQYFGKHGRLADDFATLDHLVRVKDGGKMNRKNIVLACKKCNSSRHHKPIIKNSQNENNIKKGDTVAVNFNNAQFSLSDNAEVVYIPCATGDSWIFRDLDTGDIHYVSEGCTITKLNNTIIN